MKQDAKWECDECNTTGTKIDYFFDEERFDENGLSKDLSTYMIYVTCPSCSDNYVELRRVKKSAPEGSRPRIKDFMHLPSRERFKAYGKAQNAHIDRLEKEILRYKQENANDIFN